MPLCLTESPKDTETTQKQNYSQVGPAAIPGSRDEF